MTHPRTALVIGGGIAGPAAAMALQRVGIEPKVYEARPGPTAAGVFLTLGSNGIDALRTLDADGPALASGFPTPRIIVCNGAGKPLGTSTIGLPLPDGATSQTLNRADLYRLLHDQATERGIPVEHGRKLVTAEETSDGVRATFADGSETFGDVVIGCDGVHSTVRTMIDPSAPAPTYAGLLNTGGYAQNIRVDVDAGSYRMIFGRRAFFGYAVAPDGDVWWFANIPRRTEPGGGERAADDGPDLRRQLLELFVDDDPTIGRIIAASPDIMPSTPVHTYPRLPTWHTDRMIVIGDAAHAPSPSSGQGASLSIEDAIVLASSLRDADTPARAFSRYELVRRQRVESIIRWAAKVNNAKAAGPIGSLVRDAMTPLFLRLTANSKMLRRIYDHHLELD